jgi:hypothetical protein
MTTCEGSANRDARTGPDEQTEPKGQPGRRDSDDPARHRRTAGRPVRQHRAAGAGTSWRCQLVQWVGSTPASSTPAPVMTCHAVQGDTDAQVVEQPMARGPPPSGC